MSLSPQELVVAEGSAGARIDQLVAEAAAEPRSQVQRWIEEGRVRIDGERVTRCAERPRAGARIAWSPPPPRVSSLVPEVGDLALLFEDESLIVLNKPPGIVVHPGAGRPSGTLAHHLLERYPELADVGGPGRPGIVHRLDRGTSGVLVVARTRAAYDALVRAFASRQVDKRYLGIVHGHPTPDQGTIELPIGRHPVERKRMAVTGRGRPARTGYRVRAVCDSAALVEFELFTGRTHQIRVHCQKIGYPLVGDTVYAARRSRAEATATDRPALHAWRIAFQHPATGLRVEFVAPPPDDLRQLWRTLAGVDLPIRARLELEKK